MTAARLVWARKARVQLAQVPIGLQFYSASEDLQRNVSGMLRQVRAIGYGQVETAGFEGLTAKAFRAQLDQARLVCLSTHLPVGIHELGSLFEDAHSVGAQFVVSSALFPPKSGSETLGDYRAMADRLNDLGRKAKEASLQYAYHNPNFEFRRLEGDRIGHDVLLKDTDPKLVTFELDCGWIIAAGYNPIDYFRQCPGRYRMLHVKDFAATKHPRTSLAMNERPQETEPGPGHIEFKPILIGAARAGIHDYYVEQEPPLIDMPALKAAKVDYQYLGAL